MTFDIRIICDLYYFFAKYTAVRRIPSVYIDVILIIIWEEEAVVVVFLLVREASPVENQ